MHKVSKSAARCIAFLLMLVVSAAAAQSPLDQAREAVASGDYTTAARLFDQAVKDDPENRDVLVEAGDVNMELERFNIARQLYARAVEEKSKDVEANRKLGLALSALGEHDAAIKSVRQAIKLDDEELANYMALTDVYLAIGRDSLQRAEQVALEARQKFPDAVEPYLALGDLYFAKGVFELAMMQYVAAFERDSMLIEPRVRLGRSYREMARRTTDRNEANQFYNKALVEFNRVTTVSPKLARAWYEQGEIFLLAERWQEAGTSFENYTKLRPDDPRGDLMLARAAYGGHFYQQAVAPLERVLSRDDSLSALYHDQARPMLAKSYVATKEYQKAVAIYKTLSDTAFDAESRKFYGASLLQIGDSSGAADVFTRMVAANPTDCELSLQLGDLLYKLKRYDQVISVFERRIATCPEQPATTPFLYIGLSHFTQKRYDEAIKALQSSVAADSTSFQAYYWMLNANAAKKDFAAAADVARAMERRGFASDPTNAQGMATAYFFIGLEAFQAKKFKESNDQMLKAVKLNPEYADGYLYLGFGYHSLTDKDNACRNYKLALKYNPRSEDAKKNLKALGCE